MMVWVPGWGARHALGDVANRHALAAQLLYTVAMRSGDFRKAGGAEAPVKMDVDEGNADDAGHTGSLLPEGTAEYRALLKPLLEAVAALPINQESSRQVMTAVLLELPVYTQGD